MSAASGEATNKMAEFQSGQYKLWHGQLMAQLYPWRAKEMWSEVNDCQSVKKINLILILGLADQDGPCVNVLPTYWEENFHLCPCHLCGGDRLRERFWQVWKVSSGKKHLGSRSVVHLVIVTFSVLLTTCGSHTTRGSFGRTSGWNTRTRKRRPEHKMINHIEQLSASQYSTLWYNLNRMSLAVHK